MRVLDTKLILLFGALAFATIGCDDDDDNGGGGGGAGGGGVDSGGGSASSHASFSRRTRSFSVAIS